jgi:hypothetical protein
MTTLRAQFLQERTMGYGLVNFMRLAGCAVAAAIILAAAHAAPAGAAEARIPSFSPDPLTSWYPPGLFGDDMLPPSSGPGPVLAPPDHPYRPNDLGGVQDAASNPTYRVADLSNPILQPWAIEEMQRWNDMVLDGSGVPFTARERCYPPSVPQWPAFRRRAPPMMFFIQTPDVVYLIWRGDNQFRQVYLNVPHSENLRRTWYGESVGHYEGNTLVVDTIGILDHPWAFVDNYRTPYTDMLHVVERYTLLNPHIMEVVVHVEDPGAFTTAWSARQILVINDDEGLQESVCAEIGLTPGDQYFGLQAVPIPQTEVPDF